jgi:PKD repeat protein
VGDVITLVATLLDEMGQPLAGTDVTFQVSPIGFFQGNGLQTIVTPTDGSGDAEAGLTSNETGTTTVIAETGSGLTDTLEVEFYEPVVIEGVDANTPVEVGDTAVFTASVGGTGPLTYTWSFGGEGRATGEDTATPTYLYDAPGTYPLVLTVESPFNTDQFERLVEVTRRQPASLVLEASTAAQAIDGAVELVATLFDKLGQPLAEDYDVTFTVSPIGYFVGEGQTATVLTDGSGEADATLTSAEIGTAIVTAETGDGQISDSVEVPFYEPVRITALEANSPVSFGDALHFVATVEGSGELEYAWDFGGDAQVSGQDTATPSVVYDRPGAYTVGLTVTGPYDGDTATTDVRVTGTEIHVPLIVASATP